MGDMVENFWEELDFGGPISPGCESYCPYLIALLLWPNYLTFFPQHSHLQNSSNTYLAGLWWGVSDWLGKRQVDGRCSVGAGCCCYGVEEGQASWAVLLFWGCVFVSVDSLGFYTMCFHLRAISWHWVLAEVS